MKSQILFLLLAIGLFLSFAQNQAMAQEGSNATDETTTIEVPILSRAQMEEAFINKTLWPVGSQYRLYFNDKNQFTLQTLDDYAGLGSGLLTGTFEINSEEYLCLSFSKDEARACYLVMEDPSLRKIWGLYDDPYMLVPIADSSTVDAPTLVMNRWMHGNLILKPDFHAQLDQKLDDMRALNDKKQAILNGEYTPVPADNMKKFTDAMVGRIMILPLGSIYANSNGKMKTLSMEETEQALNGSLDITDRPYDSIWFVDGQNFCMITTIEESKNFMHCDYVDVNDTTLTAKSSAFRIPLHTMTGFTRVLTQDNFKDLPKEG